VNKDLAFFPLSGLYIPMQNSDEYEQLARRLDALAAEFCPAHDENIKAEIIALSPQMAERRKVGNPLR
jgi:hypothetical protein